MKKNCLLLLSSLYIINCFAQNLIPNPSFENLRKDLIKDDNYFIYYTDYTNTNETEYIINENAKLFYQLNKRGYYQNNRCVCNMFLEKWHVIYPRTCYGNPHFIHSNKAKICYLELFRKEIERDTLYKLDNLSYKMDTSSTICPDLRKYHLYYKLINKSFMLYRNDVDGFEYGGYLVCQHSGDASVCLSNNIISCKLEYSLKKGERYYFEIYYRNIFPFTKNPDICSGTLNILFTNNDIYSEEYKKDLLKTNEGNQKYISIDTIKNESMKDWVKYSCSFVAEDNFKNMVMIDKSIKGFFLIDDLKLIPYDKIFTTENLKTGDKITLENLFFATNSSIIESESYKTLDLLLNFMQKNDKLNIKISGHTDNTGNIQDNITLSENRAKAVADYLISKGISSSRLKYEGYGSSQPIADNKTELGRKQNRRVEFEIIKN